VALGTVLTVALLLQQLLQEAVQHRVEANPAVGAQTDKICSALAVFHVNCNRKLFLFALLSVMKAGLL